jgi:hypothetical protein
MPAYAVRFKGMLNQAERERLEQAGLAVGNQERARRIGVIKTGQPIYTVEVEAASEEEALQAVRAALDPDTGNFSNWEVRPNKSL